MSAPSSPGEPTEAQIAEEAANVSDVGSSAQTIAATVFDKAVDFHTIPRPSSRPAPPQWWDRVFGSLQTIFVAVPRLEYNLVPAVTEPVAAWRVLIEEQHLYIYNSSDVDRSDSIEMEYSLSCFPPGYGQGQAMGLPWLPNPVQHLRHGLQNELIWRASNASANALNISEYTDTSHLYQYCLLRAKSAHALID